MAFEKSRWKVLQAQRNELSYKVRSLKEELEQLHEQRSYVGEVSKAMEAEEYDRLSQISVKGFKENI